MFIRILSLALVMGGYALATRGRGDIKNACRRIREGANGRIEFEKNIGRKTYLVNSSSTSDVV